MLPEINPFSLTWMEPISNGHPVYKVTLNGNSYVLKAETAADATSSSDVKWASKIMNNVVDRKKTTETKVRILNEHEIDVVATRYPRFFQDGANKVRLEETLGTPDSVWVLMHFQGNMFITDDNMDGGKKQQLFSIINHGIFWKKLGKVIAVDLFTGNNDRFDFGYYDQIPTGQEGTFWSNKGNLFINISDLNNRVPMGMDYFFAQNAFGKDGVGDQGFIRIMSNKVEVNKVSVLIIASIMSELTGYNLGVKANKNSGSKSKRTTKMRGYTSTADKYRAYLTSSIWDGLQEIKRYLVNKRNDYGRRNPQQQIANNVQRNVPNIPNHHPARQGATTPVAHNNQTVSKDTFPVNIEQRMRALNWI